MATKKPAAKAATKGKAPAKAPASKSRGLTKPVPVQPKLASQEVNVSEVYTPQFSGKSFMQRAQSQPL